MTHNIFFVDDEAVFDSMQLSENHCCDICREKGSSAQIQMHHSFTCVHDAGIGMICFPVCLLRAYEDL